MLFSSSSTKPFESFSVTETMKNSRAGEERNQETECFTRKFSMINVGKKSGSKIMTLQHYTEIIC